MTRERKDAENLPLVVEIILVAFITAGARDMLHSQACTCGVRDDAFDREGYNAVARPI